MAYEVMVDLLSMRRECIIAQDSGHLGHATDEDCEELDEEPVPERTSGNGPAGKNNARPEREETFH